MTVELPEELKKALFYVVDKDGKIPDLKALYSTCTGNLLEADVVASFLETARKQWEAELLSLRNEQRRELKERCKATAYYGQQGFLQLPLQDVVNLIAAVLGGEEKHGDDEE